MNYLQYKYNIFAASKTLLYYRVKHKCLKILELLYHSLMAKLSTLHFKKIL